MADNKKFRVYVHLDTRISTEVMAKDKEHAKQQIDALDFFEAMKHVCGREWDCWETSGGIQRVREVVETKSEYER